VRHAQINRFRLGDLKGVLEIEAAAFRRDAFPSEVFLELHQRCPDSFLVAKRSGKIVGYIASLLEDSGAEIVSLAVDPTYRRLGIGRSLMMHMLAKLRASGVRRVSLTVRPANRAATRLYSALGFHPVRRLSQYYADGCDAIEMQRIFSGATRTTEASTSSGNAA
jgi:ribosomal-protein-alanine N-acetyltransferase